MRLLVGQLAYLNTMPFEPLPGVRLFRAAPAAIGRLAAAGELDAGVLSAMDLLRNRDRYAPLEANGQGFGIACRERAGSVFLLSRRPPEELGGATIGITTETSTSVVLLRLWLKARLNVRTARFQRGLAGEHQARLVIGDQALGEREHPDPGFGWRVDLAAVWREWTGFPFVFAVWSVRRSLTERARRQLAGTVEAAITRGVRRIPEIAARMAGPLGDQPALTRYLSDFTYRFSADERAGLERFRAMVREHRLLDPA